MDLLILMLLASQSVSGRLRTKCLLSLDHQDEKQPWSYYRPGDHLIAMITTVTEISVLLLISFIQTLRFIFAIQLINKNSQLLHNLTLGYNLHDNYLSTLSTSVALLDILSTGEANVPNYGCGRRDNLLALLDGAARDISIQMSTLSGTYKVPQVSPGPVACFLKLLTPLSNDLLEMAANAKLSAFLSPVPEAILSFLKEFTSWWPPVQGGIQL